MNFIEVQDKQTFDAIYSDMKKQFPKSELRPYEKILNDILSEKPYKMAVLEDKGECIGYVTYFEKDFIWVDYLAVIGENKSKGYGSLILEKLFEHYKNKSGAYFEVELENPDEPLTTKRINFYKKIGCEILDLAYFYPNEENILQMNLMYKPLGEKIPKNVIQDIKDTFDNVFECSAKEEAFQKILKINL
ncbi:MAG: GNAT family N-acetyltransferase [Candidatus Gastranaerophilaceae bacterium]